MSEYTNAMYCEIIGENVNQKFDFDIHQVVGGPLSSATRESKCSGNVKCAFKDESDSCSIVKNKLNEKIEEEKNTILECNIMREYRNSN